MIEFEQFGWNWVTIGFIGSMVTCCLGFWGVIQQNRTIWRLRSGLSVSVVMFSYSMLFFSACAVYGATIGSLALLIVGFRVILQVPLLVGLWKFKGFKPWETALSVLCALALGAMIILPHKDIFYFVVSLGSIASFVPQIVEMVRNRTRGAVDVKFLWTVCAGAGFWSVYSLAIGDWALSIINPVFLVVAIANVVAWYLLPPAKNEVSDDRAP